MQEINSCLLTNVFQFVAQTCNVHITCAANLEDVDSVFVAKGMSLKDVVKEKLTEPCESLKELLPKTFPDCLMNKGIARWLSFRCLWKSYLVWIGYGSSESSTGTAVGWLFFGANKQHGALCHARCHNLFEIHCFARVTCGSKAIFSPSGRGQIFTQGETRKPQVRRLFENLKLRAYRTPTRKMRSVMTCMMCSKHNRCILHRASRVEWWNLQQKTTRDNNRWNSRLRLL